MNNFVIQPETTRGFTAPQKRAAPQAGSTTPSAPPVSPAPPTPSHDDIARRAYDIYNKKGRQQGQCQQNWRQAERELRRQTVTAGLAEYTEAPPAASAGSEPVVKTFPGTLPSNMGGRGSTRGGTTPMPPGGRDTKA